MTSVYQPHRTDPLRRYHEELGASAYPPPQSQVIGLCIGSLTAAAIASSQSIVDLLPLASVTVGIAFRVGLQTHEVARHLETEQGKTKPWSVAYPGIDVLHANVALGDFIREQVRDTQALALSDTLLTGTHQNIPTPNKPYVSAVGPNTITISGPPSTLERLQATAGAFQGARFNLPIHAPYHAPDLFERADASNIVSGHRPQTLEIIRLYRPRLSFYSTTTGQPYTAETTLDLLVQIVREVLTETLHWDKVLSSIVAGFEAASSAETTVAAYGPTKAAGSLVSSLQARASNPITLQDSSSWLPHKKEASHGATGSLKHPKLAIVGLAGRFPGGSNHEEFWEALEQGLDLHKPVSSRSTACRRDNINSSTDTQRSFRRQNTCRSRWQGTEHQPYSLWLLH